MTTIAYQFQQYREGALLTSFVFEWDRSSQLIPDHREIWKRSRPYNDTFVGTQIAGNDAASPLRWAVKWHQRYVQVGTAYKRQKRSTVIPILPDGTISMHEYDTDHPAVGRRVDTPFEYRRVGALLIAQLTGQIMGIDYVHNLFGVLCDNGCWEEFPTEALRPKSFIERVNGIEQPPPPPKVIYGIAGVAHDCLRHIPDATRERTLCGLHIVGFIKGLVPCTCPICLERHHDDV